MAQSRGKTAFNVGPIELENSPSLQSEILWGTQMCCLHTAKQAAWLDFCSDQASLLAWSRHRESVHSWAPFPFATRQLQSMAELFLVLTGNVSSSTEEYRRGRDGWYTSFRIWMTASSYQSLSKGTLEHVPQMPTCEEICKVTSSSYSTDIWLVFVTMSEDISIDKQHANYKANPCTQRNLINRKGFFILG